MSEFLVFETEEFLARLGKLQVRDARHIQQKLRKYAYPQLRQEPFFGSNIKKLRGYSPDTWRYRIGVFRVFYIVDTVARVVYVLSVDRRRDAYR